MLKNLLFATFFTLLFFSFSSAQNSEEFSWEYLVVSIGNFGDKQDFNPADKYLGRRQGNVGFSQDKPTQNEFDRLGTLGWELVGILPMNSGEQSNIGFAKFIFKRRLNFQRSQYESEELKKLTQELNNKKPTEPEFIDLDAVNAQSTQKEKERRANEKIEQTIRKIQGYSIISVKGTSWFPSQDDRRVTAEVVIDGTKELLKDRNKFRSSEVRNFIRQAASEIFKAAELKPLYGNQEPFQEYYDSNIKGVNIKLSVVVNYNGKTKTLAEGAVFGNWLESQYP